MYRPSRISGSLYLLERKNVFPLKNIQFAAQPQLHPWSKFPCLNNRGVVLIIQTRSNTQVLHLSKTEHLLWIAEQGTRNFLVLGLLCGSQHTCDASRHTFFLHTYETAGLQLNSLHEENSMHDGQGLHTYTHTHTSLCTCVSSVATVVCNRVRLYNYCTLLPK
jgi:hypothetical protein